MKKILLSIFGMGIAFVAFAQLPVSTIAENKNAILEEYTGIHCVFCPDGHRIAAETKAKNPDDVFLINIHTGGYAFPMAGELDFRTSFGPGLAGQTGLRGTPSGTLNRHVFSGSNTALSRGEWNNSAKTILGESSYVNVACEAKLDPVSRLMIVEVEAYFTGANAPSAMNLNVALLQNKIEGTQTGASFNPSNVLPNGNYLHNHALRHMITGQWGEVIKNTVQGEKVKRKYIYRVPADIAGIPVVLADLEIVAFMAEGKQNIISGEDGPITLTSGLSYIAVDVASSAAHDPQTDICDPTFTPKGTYTNNSATTIDTFRVSYTLNGALVSEVVNGTSVSSGATYTHAFSPINLPTGGNVISYQVSPEASFDMIDTSLSNNASMDDIVLYMPTKSLGNAYKWDFESATIGEETWINTINLPSPTNSVVDKTIDPSISNSLGAFASSSNSFLHRLKDMVNLETSEFITHKLDLSGGSAPGLRFDYACRQKISVSKDDLEIFASSDCGLNWTSVFNKSGASLSTVAASNAPDFYPIASQWKTEYIDLSAFNQADVILKFVVTAGFGGHSLYLDNIQVDQTLAIKTFESEISLAVFPNPTKDVSTISFELAEKAIVKMTVLNNVGSVVFRNNEETFGKGVHNMTFDGATLPVGIYVVNLSIGEKIITRKISLIK